MNKDTNGSAANFELEHFERNRYFQGKLMTAHDMEAEQTYHASRLETLTRVVTGTGIVSGLDISGFEHDTDELEITIEPGVAIDGQGRPIVVRTPTTRTIPTGDSDAIYLYLSYAEEPKDPVPVPGVDGGDTGQSQESRVLEIFELQALETPPQSEKTPPRLDLSSVEGTDNHAELVSDIVDAYRDSEPTGSGSDTDHTVFLGAFERTADGEWQIKVDETKRRPAVYDNDMLFALLVSQFDTDRGFSADESARGNTTESELNQIGELLDQLEAVETDLASLREELESDIETLRTDLESDIASSETAVRDDLETVESGLETRIDDVDTALRSKVETAEDHLWTEIKRNQASIQTLASFSAYRSLTASSERFDGTAETFEHRAEVSKLTLGLSEAIQTAIADRVDTDPDDYEAFVAELMADIDELVAEIDGYSTDESFTRLADTAEAVHSELAGDTSFVELVTAFDRLSQTVTMLKPTYEVYPDD